MFLREPYIRVAQNNIKDKNICLGQMQGEKAHLLKKKFLAFGAKTLFNSTIVLNMRRH